MNLLRARELTSCLEFLGRLAASANTWTRFAEAAVNGLPDLVASEITTLSVCDLRSGKRRVFGSAGSLLGDDEKASFDRHFNQHPLVQYHAYQRGRGVRRISDSVPQSRFVNSALYDEYYRRIGIDHAVAVPIRVDDQVLVSLVLNRCRRDFSDRDCALLEAVRIPLAQMYGQALAMTQAQAALAAMGQILEQQGSAWMRVSGRPRMLHAAGEQSLAWIAEQTGHLPRIGQPLPAGLEHRIEEAAAEACAGRPLCPAAAPTGSGPQPVGPGLVITLQPLAAASDTRAGDTGAGDMLIWLRRSPGPQAPSCFASLLLTGREREVMVWLAAGKTNRDIAALLGCSHRTVQKHLEHIYPKLGVETRTAAVMRALDLCLP